MVMGELGDGSDLHVVKGIDSTNQESEGYVVFFFGKFLNI